MSKIEREHNKKVIQFVQATTLRESTNSKNMVPQLQ